MWLVEKLKSPSPETIDQPASQETGVEEANAQEDVIGKAVMDLITNQDYEPKQKSRWLKF